MLACFTVFIGTGAKRSPAKPRPLRSLGNAKISWQLAVYSYISYQKVKAPLGVLG